MIRDLPDIRELPRRVFPRVETLLPGSRSLPHSHDWAQLTYAVSGTLEILTPQGAFVAPPQLAVWIPPGMTHEVLSTSKADLRSLYIRQDRGSASGPSARCRVLAVSLLVRELILSVAAIPAEYDESGAQGRLVGVLLDQLDCQPPADLALPMPVDARLTGLCHRLLREPDNDMTEEQWAREACMSGRNLSRVFRRQTGLSFGEWRNALRLLSSLAKLEAGKSVTSVALECGYASTSSFIASFKKRFGKTPGKFYPYVMTQGRPPGPSTT